MIADSRLLLLLLALAGCSVDTPQGPVARQAKLPADALGALAATRDIPAGSVIDATMLRPSHFPAAFVPDPTFVRTDEVIGRVNAELILAGELIRAERLTAADAGAGLNAMVPRGMRAMHVPTDDPLRITLSGQYVDLMAAPESGPCMVGHALRVVDGSPTDSGLWIAATPQQALAIAQLGDVPLAFSVRNPIDVEFSTSVVNCEVAP